MEITASRTKLNTKKIAYILLVLGFATAIAQPSNKKAKAIADKRTEESKVAFLKAYSVFMHPRCMNCHPNGDVPLQGDDSHLHAQNVQRGIDGKGIYALKCKNCHQDANLAGLNMPPGSPNWALPPMKHRMVFQGQSARELALHFKNSDFTGFKNLDDMIRHVEKEPLVIHSFIPLEGRSTIAMSHVEFVAAVKEWIAKGAAIPDR